MAYTKLNTFHLFAGAGGGILGDLLLGHNPIGACEIEPYPSDVLLARQADGHLPNFPIWDDVATLDGNPWRGSVDVLCGGFPCQDISSAGKGAGITGERSGLWKEYARLIGEMRPRFVFAENSPLLRTRGLGVVLEDLAALGYNARWGIIGAGAVGAPHKRDRMWVLAYSENQRDSGRKWQPKNNSKKGDERGVVRGGGGFNVGCSCVAYAPEQGLEGHNKREETTERREDKGLFARAEGVNGFCQKDSANVADTNSSGSDEDRSDSELRTSGFKQSSKDSRITNETEGREVTGWWYTDPAELPDTEGQGTGTLRNCGEAEGEVSGNPAQHIGECSSEASQGPEDSATEPAVGRVAHGVANRVDRLKAIGNGQVPQCAAVAFSILSEGLL